MTSSHTLFFERPPMPGSKLEKLLHLLQRGETIIRLATALGWKPHTVRAAMTRLRQRGYYIVRNRLAVGPSVFGVLRDSPFQL
ncbi:DUF3489 domain-containing protein [Henriciella sp.]|uniref:DUF3489 domain-containing protein n=1 Tax=Henriciella sp. TaxID=1968823 RepID=UPI000C0FABA6|nr:MAG: hypothetical protein COA64_01275 [Henriciella sp.]